MRWSTLGVLVGLTMSCTRDRQASVGSGHGSAPGPAVLLVAKRDRHPVRKTTPHCALTGQPVQKARQKVTERRPDPMFATSLGDVVGILLDTDPVAIEGFGSARLAVPIDRVEIGDVVRARLDQVEDASGPELGMKHVLSAIEPARGEPDRIGTVVTYWRYAKPPLEIRDDGNVVAGRKPVLQLDDAELAQLLKTFGDVGFAAAPRAYAGSVDIVGTEISGGTITLSCTRLQTSKASEPSLGPLVRALDAIAARIETQSSYRLQYARRDKIEWIDWKEPVPVAEILANQADRNAWHARDHARASTHISDAVLRKLGPARDRGTPHAFVRDGGKVYLVVDEAGDPRRSGEVSLLTAYECGASGRSRCHVWSPQVVPLDGAGPQGVALSRDQILALGLEIRDDLDKTDEPVTLGLVGDYVYSGLAVWRSVTPAPGMAPIADEWQLKYSEKAAISKWPASAPSLATNANARARVQDAMGRARTDLPGDPMYAKVPADLLATIGKGAYFDEAGAVYMVYARCTTAACGAGTYFGLEVAPVDAKSWAMAGLELASVPASSGVVLSPEQVAANQRMLESMDSRGETWREGNTIYRYVVAGRRPGRAR